MSTLDNSIVAHMNVGGKTFEILVDKEKGYGYKTGKKKDLANVLVVEEIYEDTRKGERHKDAELQKAFGTTDIYKIAEIILNKGEIQLTTEQKRKLTAEKRNAIIAVILREAIDPRTKAPHTRSRVETAMDEARVKIDPFDPPEAQLEEVLKKLRPIIPMKFEHIKIAVKVPSQYAQRCYGTLKNYGIKKEEWTQTGELVAVLEMPAGLQGEFYDRINKMTSGSVETKIMER